MIHGIGTDILDIKRIAVLYERYGEALPRRILSECEWTKFSGSLDKVRFLAKRFAAKEAFAKAIGTGIRPPVSLRHIGIVHNELGKPEFACTDELQAFLQQHHISSVHLSLSDEKDCVLAFAVAEKTDRLPEK